MLTEYWPLDKSFTSIHFLLQILIQLNRLVIYNLIQTQYYMFSKIFNCLVQHLTNKHKVFLVQKCIILETFVDIYYLLNYIGLKLILLPQDLEHFLHFLSCLLIFLLANNFIDSGICNSSLYPSSILNTKLLLILLI